MKCWSFLRAHPCYKLLCVYSFWLSLSILCLWLKAWRNDESYVFIWSFLTPNCVFFLSTVEVSTKEAYHRFPFRFPNAGFTVSRECALSALPCRNLSCTSFVRSISVSCFRFRSLEAEKRSWSRELKKCSKSLGNSPRQHLFDGLALCLMNIFIHNFSALTEPRFFEHFFEPFVFDPEAMMMGKGQLGMPTVFVYHNWRYSLGGNKFPLIYRKLLSCQKSLNY